MSTRIFAAALAALALAAALSGCGSGGGLADGTSPEGSGGVADQAVAHSSVLASALDRR